MNAEDLVKSQRDEYLKINADPNFKASYNAIKRDKDEELVNYVMNKLLLEARKQGGNVFAGENNLLNEYINEFYIDYKTLDDDSKKDNWSQYIRMPDVSGGGKTKAVKGKAVPVDEPKPDAVDIEAIKKQAIADYKLEQKRKEVEAMQKKAEEQKAKEEAKKKALEESKKSQPQQMSLFDL